MEQVREILTVLDSVYLGRSSNLAKEGDSFYPDYKNPGRLPIL